MKLSSQEIQFIQNEIPLPHNTPEKFEKHIDQKIEVHKILCTTLIKTVDSLLAPLKSRYRHRFFCRIDDSNQTKSPVGIIEKILRSQKKEAKPNRPPSTCYTIDNFEALMTDLVRFRIVCNFLSDVKTVAYEINASGELKDRFYLKREDSLDVRPSKRKSGERSVKFILEYKKRRGLFLEIQIMTQLEEAWDKKDHFLIYEKRRMDPGKDDAHFPDYLDAKMFAMSELLYVADNYFDDLRSTREDNLEIETGEKP